jgi:RHS repeat-associated protein
VVTKRFFAQGMKLETGTNAGSYFYTRDHLGSIRELTDIGGNVRARYAYDPYGRRAKLTGDLEADFGFAGMFWAAEANLALTHFRAYDPGLGRWLSRDPLRRAEEAQGPNLYSYVRNEPIRRTDPLGLACAGTLCKCVLQPGLCTALGMAVGKTIQTAAPELEVSGPPLENAAMACSEGFAGAAQALAPAVEAAAPELEGALPAIEAEAPEVAAVAPRIAQVYQAVQPQLYAGVRIPSWFSDPAYLQNVERIGWVARMLDLWRDYVSEEDWPDFVNAMEQQATAIFGGQ